MNVFKKLVDARVKLQDLNIKKTGKGYGYNYYELSDFIPNINKINQELGLATQVVFNHDLATLNIIDTDDKELKQIQFTSPMSEAKLKNCHAVQNLGAVQTYLRRYLYMNAYEIVEKDVLDGSDNIDNKKPLKNQTQKKQENKIQIDWTKITRALSNQVSKNADDLAGQHRAIISHYEEYDLENDKRYCKLYDAAEKRILEGGKK